MQDADSTNLELLRNEIQKLKKTLEQERKSHTKIQNELTKDLLALEQDKRGLEIMVDDLRAQITQDPGSPVSKLADYLGDKHEYGQFSNHLRVLGQQVSNLQNLLYESAPVSEQLSQTRAVLEQKFRRIKTQLQNEKERTSQSTPKRNSLSDQELIDIVQDFSNFFLLQTRFDTNWQSVELHLQEMRVIVDLTLQKIALIDRIISESDRRRTASPVGIASGRSINFTDFPSYDEHHRGTHQTTPSKKERPQGNYKNAQQENRNETEDEELGEISPHLRQLIERNRQQTIELQRLLSEDIAEPFSTVLLHSTGGRLNSN